MAYGTPVYNYERDRGGLARQKALTDQANEFGRFLGQERFRRSKEDLGESFERRFPKVGNSFSRRGIWNSGLRKKGQRTAVNAANKDFRRLAESQATENAQWDMRQTNDDVRYENELLALYDRMQASRATSEQDFAGPSAPGRGGGFASGGSLGSFDPSKIDPSKIQVDPGFDSGRGGGFRPGGSGLGSFDPSFDPSKIQVDPRFDSSKWNAR
jgi:hypothetical protein